MLDLHEPQVQCDHTLGKRRQQVQGTLQLQPLATLVGQAYLGVPDG